MAVERVTLKIDIDVDDGKLGALEGRLKRFESSVRQSTNRMDSYSRSADKLDRSFNKLGRTTSSVGRIFTKFLTTLAKFSFVAYAGQVAILTTALLGAKLAMATGRVAAQGYQLALKGVGAAAAGAATAIAAAAAAMQQFQAASLAPFAGGFNNANRALVSQSSAVRGLLGNENSAKVLKSLTQAGVSPSSIASTQRGLMNLAGGDAAATASLAAALGSNTAFAEALGGTPGGSDAFLASGMSAAQFAASQSAGGQVDLLGGTVVGTLKTEFVTVIDTFAQVGLSLLAPVRESIIAMGGTVRTFAMQLVPAVNKFSELVLGNRGGMATGFQKMADSIARLANKVMPTFEGQMERFGSMAESVEMFFFRMGERLRPLEDGAEVLMDMFGAMFDGMTGNGVLANFNATLRDNADTFHALGDSIGNLFQAFLGGSGGGEGMLTFVDRLTNVFNQAATDLVPPLKEIATALKDIIMVGLPPVLSTVSGILGVLAPILGGVSSVAGAGGGFPAGALLMTGMMMRGRGRRGPGGMGGRAMAFARRNPGAAAAGVAGLGLFSAGFSGAGRDGAGAGDFAMGIGGGALTGAAVGSVIPIIGTAAGAVIGGAIGGIVTAFRGNSARKRRAGNLNNFMAGIGELSGFDAIDAFNVAMENTDELASQLDMDADDLTKRLNELQPSMDALNDAMEAKIAPNVEFLTEVMGYSADAARELAMTLTDMEMAATKTDGFNAMLDRLMGISVSGSGLVESTASGQAGVNERNQALINRIGGLGGITAALQTEEGRRLVGETIDALALTGRQRGESVTGASIFALDTLEQTFGASAGLTELEGALNASIRSQFPGLSGTSLDDAAAAIDNLAGGGLLSQVTGIDGHASAAEANVLGAITQEVTSNTPTTVIVNGVIDPVVKDQLLNEVLDAVANAGLAQAEVAVQTAITSAPEAVTGMKGRGQSTSFGGLDLTEGQTATSKRPQFG